MSRVSWKGGRGQRCRRRVARKAAEDHGAGGGAGGGLSDSSPSPKSARDAGWVRMTLIPVSCLAFRVRIQRG